MVRKSYCMLNHTCERLCSRASFRGARGMSGVSQRSSPARRTAASCMLASRVCTTSAWTNCVRFVRAIWATNIPASLLPNSCRPSADAARWLGAFRGPAAPIRERGQAICRQFFGRYSACLETAPRISAVLRGLTAGNGVRYPERPCAWRFGHEYVPLGV